MDYLISICTMLLCSALFLWLRAVFAVSKKEQSFDWGVFLEENRNRIILMAAGCALAAAVWHLDPSGIKAFLDQYGLGAYFGSRGAIGAGVGYVSLFFKKE